MKASPFFLTLLIFWNSPAHAAPALFHKGVEEFRIVDEKNQTPRFRVLKDTLLKQSFAVALNSAFSLTPSPSGSVPNYVELVLEKIRFLPHKKSSEKALIHLRLSGRDFDLDTALRKQDLIEGKIITVTIPSRTNEIALFTLKTKGTFQLRYFKNKDELTIDAASARMDIEGPLGEPESESLQFRGRGIRLP